MRVTREDIEMYELVVDKEKYVMEIIEGFKRKGRIEYAEVEEWLRDDVKKKVKEILEEEMRLSEERMLEQLRQSFMMMGSSMEQVGKSIPPKIGLDKVNGQLDNWTEWREFKRKL